VRGIYTDCESVRVFRLGVSLLHALAGGEYGRAYSLAWFLSLALMGLASVRINNVPIFTVAIGG